ncbi:NAD(P)/FAD-dependent oxidoreductase [Danxiaibacter flavus]|uniref:NAD(P)/FAD-dependent oxidoreductase n=1 Tax=Danxiaibacter flavus TaxID=3049108 RepID=A0ABV3Z7T3_9BACT|nr:NAD(P)/FAD-dependent oxidoreductase [Chitinophagaceae bacterium DXS]
MQKKISFQLLPPEAADDSTVKDFIAKIEGIAPKKITGFYRTKQSIDARSKQPKVNITVNAFIDEPYHERIIEEINFKDVTHSPKKVIVVGAGPAGLFAALKLIESGVQPILIERGKDVRARRRDLAVLNKEGIVNTESNYCFGEGGAGTYSDGKLYTRSTKRGDVNRILNLLVQFGADERILYEAHPHIGTNQLPKIITAMRDVIIAYGGKVLFETKLTGFLVENNTLKGITTAAGEKLMAEAVILATGHSARDIFELFYNNNILIEAKPFALGVRIEHQQALIDSIQYHCPIPSHKDHSARSEYLPPASYGWVEQVNNKGVFSFCMCPGGIIAPAATAPGELVVNGWSPSKRNNPYSNSGIVVSTSVEDIVKDKDFKKLMKENKWSASHPLLLMYFQQMVEQKAFEVGGGKFVAPAQRMVDFCNNKLSSSLPDCSYLPGIHSSTLNNVLPNFVLTSLQEGFKAFGKKMKGYYTNDAVVVATESRTSSPVRIPRDADSLQHPQIKQLYPCGEGAGYAGGIVSAAMDGERVAEKICEMLDVRC